MPDEILEFDDAILLDYLESLAIPPGMGWKVRQSTTGRGWRLQTTSQTPNFSSVRQAIAYHMQFKV